MSDSRSLTGGAAGQRDALVLEAQALRDAELGRFGAGVRVQQPGGGAQRQQVVVGDAVVAAESVLGIDASRS